LAAFSYPQKHWKALIFRGAHKTINLEHHLALASAVLPPPEIVFEGIVRSKIAHLSFMDPPKLVDALALIWNEEHKWQAIATEMGDVDPKN
jgi:hypothetical protein